MTIFPKPHFLNVRVQNPEFDLPKVIVPNVDFSKIDFTNVDSPNVHLTNALPPESMSRMTVITNNDKKSTRAHSKHAETCFECITDFFSLSKFVAQFSSIQCSVLFDLAIFQVFASLFSLFVLLVSDFCTMVEAQPTMIGNKLCIGGFLYYPAGCFFHLAKSVYRHVQEEEGLTTACLLYTSPSPRDRTRSRMPSSA